MGDNSKGSTFPGTDAGAAFVNLGRIRGGRSRARAVTALVAATCMSWPPGGRALAEARDARTPGGGRAPSFEVGTNGLRSLRFAGEEFVDRECFRVGRAVMKRWDGTTYQADLKTVRRELDGGGKRLLLSYRWGKVACTFAPEGGRLRLTIEVANESDDILAELGLELMMMRFPQAPKGWAPHMPYRSFNLGSPTVHFAACRKVTVAVCNEDIGRPLMVGWAGRESLMRRPLVMSTASDWMQHMLNPMMYRPVYPGGHDSFEITLRFAPAGAPEKQIVGDLWRRFAEAHPFRLNWRDRRPIGALHLSSSNLKARENPRGWFNDRQADFLTEAGRTAFRERLLDYARRSVGILKDIGAQGMITWDIEGQEYPHAISYLGDPRSLPPEMGPVADEYFKTFRDAGLRVGVTIRPQVAVRPAYGAAVRQTPPSDATRVLDRKIVHARKRWGCTLFYVDSNGDPNVPMPAEVFQRLAAKHPGVLLVPEHENAQYYSSTAPYRCYGNLKQLGTPRHVRRIYPDAFSCVAVAHADPAPVEDRLVEDVRRGDILVINAWYRWKGHETLKRIYRRAGR